MIWIIGFIVVVLILGAISSVAETAGKAQKSAEFNSLLNVRVDAYQDYLRRTPEGERYEDMSNNELKELLATTIRQYKKEEKNSRIFPAIMSVGAVGFSLFVGIAEQNLIAGVVLGLLSGILGNAWLNKRARRDLEKKYRQKGFDVDRLRIDP